MEQDLTALAAVAATTLVGTMTKDGWEQVKAAVVSLWRRVHPAQADMVDVELDAARRELPAMQDEQVERDLMAEWGVRLRRLAAADPQGAAGLRQLIEGLPADPGETETAQVISVRMQAKSTGRSRIYQAGRDQKITER